MRRRISSDENQRLAVALSIPEHDDVPYAPPTWFDIATAPKDGTRVLMFDSEAFKIVTIGLWEGAWIDEDVSHGTHTWQPTHWQPLPTPPVTEKP